MNLVDHPPTADMLGWLERIFSARQNYVAFGEEETNTERVFDRFPQQFQREVGEIQQVAPPLLPPPPPPPPEEQNAAAEAHPRRPIERDDSGVFLDDDDELDLDEANPGDRDFWDQDATIVQDPVEQLARRNSQGSEMLWEGFDDPDQWPEEERARYFEEVDRVAESRNRAEEAEVEAMLPFVEDPSDISRATLDLEPFQIAHSIPHLRAFDQLDISWAVQWQIGVLVSSKTLQWDEIPVERLRQLQGSNSDAGPRVSNVLLGLSANTPITSATATPWSELDREQSATEAERIGLADSENPPDPNQWWGGRVEQMAVMTKAQRRPSISSSQTPPKYEIRLQQLKVEGKSCRFRRRFGSRRFIRLQLPDVPKGGPWLREFNEFLSRPFILHGRVYYAFYGEQGVAHLFETDENFQRTPLHMMRDLERVSFEDFSEWHNPIALNGQQAITKYCARWKLGLSTSIPTVTFEPDNIKVIEDIGNKDPMTDGCGLINRVAMRIIQKHQQLDTMPTAVQGRLAGAKGLWVLEPNDITSVPRIWCTKTQIKINYSPEALAADPALRTLDFLRYNQTKIPTSLSWQPIINLAHNHVPPDVFKDILQSVVETELKSLLVQWREKQLLALWGSISIKGAVAALRKRREQAVFVRKFSRIDEKETAMDEISKETVLQVDRGSFAPDPTSGYPDNVYERAVELLQAGFEPQHCPMLTEAVKNVIKKERDRILGEVKLPLPHSAEAWAVPDFSGILGPGEVYFCSSEPLELPGGAKSHVLTGPVVVWRSPNRLPSDTQKLHAVDCPQLRHWENVFVFSTKGDRSAMSLLSGGDFDGDIVAFTWHPKITRNFQNASLYFADPPPNFEKDWIVAHKEFAQSYVEKLCDHSKEQRRAHLQQQYLLACRRDFCVGVLSNIADEKARIYGYDSPEAIHYAYLFTYALDAVKSGKHPKPDAHKGERKDRLRNQARADHLPPFIKDTLERATSQILLEFNEDLKKEVDAADSRPDRALLQPWDMAIKQAERLQAAGYDGKMKELESIKDFVQEKYASWREKFLLGSWLQKGDVDMSPRKFKDRRTSLEAITKSFNDDFDGSSFLHVSQFELPYLKASCAYTFEVEEQRRKVADFSFHVAFSDLSLIKCIETRGPYKTMLVPYMNNSSVRRGFLQEWNDRNEGMNLSD